MITASINPFPTLAQDASLDPASKVWIYICNRPLSDAESAQVAHQLSTFCQNWTAHNQALRAKAEVFLNRVILLLVDESMTGASGCSIDKSVHFLEALGDQMNVDFFDRMQFAWAENDHIQFGNKAQLAEKVASGAVNEDTLMLNTTLTRKSDFAEKWLLPWKKSWHKRVI